MSDTYVVASFEEAQVKPPNLESSRSGVSWGAILAGGVTAAAISLILLLIGAGLGFASLSPYAGDSISATGLAAGAIIWLIVTQWIASLFGGYFAGRLRTKWADRQTQGAVSRLQGSPTMLAAGSSGSCSRMGPTSWRLVMTRVRSGGTRAARRSSAC